MMNVIIFMAVFAVVSAAAVPLAMRIVEEAEERLTERRFDLLEAGLRHFYRDHDRLPTSSEGLSALVTDPGTGAWRGPYISTLDSSNVFEDARGRAFSYEQSAKTATITAVGFSGLARQVEVGGIDQAWRARAIEEMNSLRTAAQSYVAQYGGLPDSIGDLVPAYLGADYAQDPWGTVYAIDTGSGILSSAGPDGTFGTSDDITLDLGSTGAASLFPSRSRPFGVPSRQERCERGNFVCGLEGGEEVRVGGRFARNPLWRSEGLGDA